MSKQVYDYCKSLFALMVEGSDSSDDIPNVNKCLLERQEYGDDDLYDDAPMFDVLYKYLVNLGGWIEFRMTDNTDVQFEIHGDNIMMIITVID